MKLIFMIPLQSIKVTLAYVHCMCVHDSTLEVIYEYATKLLMDALAGQELIDAECLYSICSKAEDGVERINILNRVLFDEFSLYFKDIENLIKIEGEEYKNYSSITTDIVGHGHYFKIEVIYPED